MELSEQTVEILSEYNLSNVLDRLSLYPRQALDVHPKASNGDSKLSDIRSKLSNEKKLFLLSPKVYLTTLVNSGFSSFATVIYTLAEVVEPSIDRELTVKRYSVVSPTVRLPALTGVPIGMG